MARFECALARMLMAFVVFETLIALPAFSQITTIGDDTSVPIPGAGHDYIKLLDETVNPANGSVSVRIQVPIPKGRGITIPFGFNYDSNGVNHLIQTFPGQALWQSNISYLNQGGWSYAVPMLTSTAFSANGGTPPNTWTCNYSTGYMFQDAGGGRHALGVGSATAVYSGGSEVCDTTPYWTGGDPRVSAALSPATFGNIDPSATISDADGAVYFFHDPHLHLQGNYTVYTALPTYVEDRNGNKVVFNDNTGNNNGTFTIADTVGRTAVSVSGFGPSGASNTATISGLSGSYTITWESVSSNYSLPHLNYYQSPSGCPGIPSVTNTQVVVKSITLPNGQQYQFFYDSTYGLLKEIIYPTGAWVKYTWKTSEQYLEPAEFADANGHPGGCEYEYSPPVVATRQVSFNGSTVALTQTFAPYDSSWNGINWTSRTITVSTADNVSAKTSSTVYTYAAGTSGEPLPAYDWYKTYEVGLQVPLESTVQYNDWGGALLQTDSKTWYEAFDLASESVTLSPSSTSKVTYCYIGSSCVPATVLSQLQSKATYDFNGQLLKTTTYTYQSFSNTLGSITDRPCKVVTTDGSGKSAAETDYLYDSGTALCGISGSAATAAVSGLLASTHDETTYASTSTTPRANTTTVTRVCFQGSTSCNNSVTKYTYDETGQVLTMTDPCGNATCSDMTGTSHVTTYSYANSFTVLSGGQNTAYSPSWNANAYLTKITDPLGHVSSYTYDFNNSQVTSSKDQNDINAGGAGTTYSYNDTFARPTEISYPDGGLTTYAYQDIVPITITEDKLVYSGFNLEHKTIVDGSGHPIQTQLTSDSDGTDYVDTIYDGLGQKHTVSNPYRSTSDPTYGLSTYQYDALGRVTQEAPPDGTVPTNGSTCLTGNLCTSYSGNMVTVSDQAGAQRKNQSDGLGRLTAVWEDPNGLKYETDYQYDALSNLICAVQKATDTTQLTTCSSASATWRPRSFVYDSLSRLVSTANPESGTVTYSYDTDGNLSQKKAPLPDQTGTSQVTTNYIYDVLSRLTQKNYVGMTQAVVRFGYDGIAPSGCTPTQISGPTNLIGRRSSMCDGSGSASWSYDQMGRVIEEQRAINGVTKQLYYDYELDGEPSGITYPDGKQIAFSPYGNGLPIQITDNDATFQSSHYYAPNGAEAQLYAGPPSNADAVFQVFYYNKRFQPAVMYAVDSSNSYIASYCYDFHVGGGGTIGDINVECTFASASPGNNGNLYQVANNLDNNRTQNFSYDTLNRIKQAYTSGPNWGETFTIDAWGNLTNKGPVSGKTNYEALNVAPATTANHVAGSSYDAAGNMTNDGMGHAFTYDAENRLATAGGVTYTYDGDGSRVMKSNGTIYWTGAGSDALAESNLSGTISEEYVHLNGRRFLRMDRPSGTVHLYFSDLVGSARLVTDINGNPQKQSDYYPYGGEIVISGSDGNRYKFAGKERDSESNLDYFETRHYASTMGRFMQPDVPFADQDTGNPQSWNMYSYVHNNPLRYTDPTGNACVQGSNGEWHNDNSGGESCADVDRNNQNAQASAQATATAPLVQLINNDPHPMDNGAISPGLLGPGDFILFSGLRFPSFITEFFGRLFGTAAETSVKTFGEGVTKVGANALLKNGTKAAARDIIEAMADSAQKASLKRALQAAGSQAKISLEAASDGSVRMIVERAGVNGAQQIIKTVAADGSSKTVQTATDAAGTLVHYDPKN